MGLFSKFRERLEWEIMGVIVCTLLIGFAVLTVLNIKSNTNSLIEQEKAKFDMMAVSLTKSIENMMISGNAPIVGGWIQDLREADLVRTLQVLRTDGTEAFKDNRTIDDVNSKLGVEAFKRVYKAESSIEGAGLEYEDDSRFQSVLSTGKNESFLDVVSGEEAITTLFPILNQERCHSCHAASKGEIRAILRITNPITGIRAIISRNMWEVIIISVVTIVINIIIIQILLRRLVIRPIKRMVNVSNKFASGDLTSRLDDIGSRDEVGTLAESLNSMGDKFGETIDTIKDSVHMLGAAANHLAGSANSIVIGTEEQSEKATHVATASQQMNATIVEVAKNASAVAESSREANTTAVEGGEIVNKTIESMKGIAVTAKESSAVVSSLGNRSNEIGKIISVIEDIADQTNLLALNAAIEAARAGEQGRGFAVVADEVRKLAERTSKATKEISEMINAIQDETGQAITTMDKEVEVVEAGVSFAEEAGESLKNIVAKVDTVAGVIEQIATASEEQSVAADQISGDIEFVASITKDTFTNAREIAASCNEMSQLVMSLEGAVGLFKVRESKDEPDQPATSRSLSDTIDT